MKISRRRNSRRPFAVLDIGSSKICCMIGEIDKLGTLSLIGQGTHASAGMRAGEVNVLSDFSDAIGNCVQSAERAAGLSITSVSVVMPGGRPHSAFGTQHMTLSDRTVSRRDIRRLLDRCGAQALDPALQLMQLLASAHEQRSADKDFKGSRRKGPVCAFALQSDFSDWPDLFG